MDIRKLQRAIVDGLEDVKGQNIVVFNTEHLSALFERVIIASGTSNRQTKALAASVRDAVKAAGAPPPRVEGEANGEWIIVDCGPAVVHVMQPTFREYYHLEELWGDKPVRMRLGAEADPRARTAQSAAHDDAESRSASPARKDATGARKAAKKAGPTKTGATKTGASRTASKKTTAKRPAAKQPARKASSPRATGASRHAGVRTSSGGVRSGAGTPRAATTRAAASKSARPARPATKKSPPRKTAARTGRSRR
jgi:ribosome-associated protein